MLTPLKTTNFFTYKVTSIVTATLSTLAFIYYLFFTLDNNPLSLEDVLQAYKYKPEPQVELTLTKLEDRLFEFTYTSFDGSTVKGQINYPNIIKETYPVLIGMHAMGRSYPRWWKDSIKGRETVTQVNKLTDIAIEKGIVVIAIDARHHGSRKQPDTTLRTIMLNLSFLGNKTDYIDMITSTVIDHRILLDWIEQQPQLDINSTHVAGYSMGGQMSLLLAGVDKRINNVLSIVPPYLDDKTATVAPKNVMPQLTHDSVWLVTSNDDENATEEQNFSLFSSIPNPHKVHITFDGNHILPEDYVNELVGWFDLAY
jgi:dienelactone hydrolase